MKGHVNVMKPNDALLFERGPASETHSRILVMHFYGSMDAGGAGRMAVAEMLRALPNERVATFDSDQFLDYRSHRPIMTVRDWVSEEMVTHEIAIDRVRDDLGNPILLLHGPEPDAKWEAFARIVADFVKEAGVEISVSFHGIPSSVPHTRATPVHVQATDASLIPPQPKMVGSLQFPAPASSFVQRRLAERGVNGIALLAAVPFYMAESGYPAGSSALLSSLSDFADLSLPVGNLELGAAQDQGTIEQLIEANPEIMATITSLEEHYDAWSPGESSFSLNSFGTQTPLGHTPKQDKDIGDVIERYLANLSRSETASDDQPSTDDQSVETAEEDPLTAALKRVQLRATDPEAVRAMTPRHRADSGDDASLYVEEQTADETDPNEEADSAETGAI